MKRELIGYLFEGVFYPTLEDLKGKTMNENNKPKPIYSETEDATEN